MTWIKRSVDQIQHSLSHPVLNNDRHANMISACSKTVTQYKFDLMAINLETIQMTQRDQREVLVALQNELRETMPTETLQQVIANRRENMIQRHALQLQYKLQMFFDGAPMASEKQRSKSLSTKLLLLHHLSSKSIVNYHQNRCPCLSKVSNTLFHVKVNCVHESLLILLFINNIRNQYQKT